LATGLRVRRGVFAMDIPLSGDTFLTGPVRPYITKRLNNPAGLMDDALSRTFAALADPTRRAILDRLTRGDAAVTEIAEPFAMTLPAISKHLKVLERAKLIERQRDGQWRRCRLAPAPLGEAADWLGRYRRFWRSSLDNLDRYLSRVQRGDHGKRKN
jgi:DNA-binding transcriptional ArsR family regulator